MERCLNVLVAVCGLFYVLAAFLFLAAFPHGAHAASPNLGQATLQYCNDRAKLARDIARDMERGATTDQINIGWKEAAESEEEAAGMEKWVAELKAEINAAALTVPREKADWAQLVAQKIIEQCWYDYGKHRVGKHTAAPGFIRAASSQVIADPKAARYATCSEVLMDEVHAGNMLGSGRATAEELRGYALASAEDLGLKRFDKVMKIIDAAEKAQSDNKLQAWFDALWAPCLAGQ